MAEAHADTILPVPAWRAFEEATDLARADWLPAVRRLQHIEGPISGVGARYEAEVDVPGHRLHGVLVCREFEAPRRAVYALERGLDLTIVVLVQPADPGCRLELRVSYKVGGLAGWAVERTTIAPVRRAVEQALTTLATRFQGRTPGEASDSPEPGG
jgi:Polyketide cyclase / dehydrase and lipid transport